MQKLTDVRGRNCIKCGTMGSMQALVYCDHTLPDGKAESQPRCRHGQEKEHLIVRCTECSFLIKDVDVV